MAAAAAARVPRDRLVCLAVLAAFLLGALWLACALHISRSVGRCLAVEGSVWLDEDEECFIMISWTTTAVIAALAFTAALSYGEAARRVEQDAAGGARDGDDGRPDPEPERGHGRPSDAAIHAFVFLQIHCLAAVLIFWGKAFRYAGARRLEKDPADELAASLFKSGPFYYNAGYLSLSAVYCCSFIPYALFRLMRFVGGEVCGIVAGGLMPQVLEHVRFHWSNTSFSFSIGRSLNE